MASPTLDLLCCSFFGIANATNTSDIEPTVTSVNMSDVVPADHSDYLHRVKMYFYLYNSTVIAISVFSVLGSLFMLFPRRRDTSNLDSAVTPGLMEIRQKWILFWLSFADIMACLGLIVLSSESLHILVGSSLTNKLSSSRWEWSCILATAWIHFFFFATYVWITCYTVDVYLFLQKCTVKYILRFYLVISWLLPIAFISFGLWALYRTTEPEMSCSLKKGDEQLLTVYYLCLFVPMVFALVINPILYFLAVRKVSPLMRGRGMYTDREREIERQVKKKFLKIVIVLEICWFPNLINGILLLCKVPLTMKAYPIIWILMAILNPLQAFLNTLVYWGPTGCSFLSFSRRRLLEEAEDSPSEYLQSHPPWKDAAIPSDTENTPLIRGRARDALN